MRLGAGLGRVLGLAEARFPRRNRPPRVEEWQRHLGIGMSDAMKEAFRRYLKIPKVVSPYLRTYPRLAKMAMTPLRSSGAKPAASVLVAVAACGFYTQHGDRLSSNMLAVAVDHLRCTSLRV